MISSFFERIMIEPYTQVEQASDGTNVEVAQQTIVVSGIRTRIAAMRRDNLQNGEGVFAVSATTVDNHVPPSTQTLVPSMAFPDREAALKAGRKILRRRR